MTETDDRPREGSLAAPTRHALNWQEADFWNPERLAAELERVYDICHGCRRCVSLCNAFPTLFDLVDNSESMEVDSVAKSDYGKVVEQCYLCDLCYLTKCPYVPPHEWNVDFPHLMLRAKAVSFKQGNARLRDKMLTSTDVFNRIASVPLLARLINGLNRNKAARGLMRTMLGIHPEAPLPVFHPRSARERLSARQSTARPDGAADRLSSGKLAIFLTCYGNRNAPGIVEDMIAVFEHNGLEVAITREERCCGMPKLELGDLAAVERLTRTNIPELARIVDQGYALTAPIPSCVLMFKQELPLMFPDDITVRKVQQAFFDPFEFLSLRHRDGSLNTEFKYPLGKVAWHVPCHQRVQKIGLKTKEILELVPGTTVTAFERCSGHDGTYAVKSENYDNARKICQPVVNRMREANTECCVSDCPMAGTFIQAGLADGKTPQSPFSLLRKAYGI